MGTARALFTPMSKARGRSHVMSMSTMGLALDIDGVFLRGHTPIPNGKLAIQKLYEQPLSKRVPHIFVTNGGGVDEASKAKQLSHLLEVNIDASLILQSHTPFRDYVQTYHNKRVLIVGSSNCIDVAKNYGFNKVVTARQLVAETPSIFKALSNDILTQLPLPENGAHEPVSAIFVIGDPADWAVEMQVMTDVMISDPMIPLYSSNSDFVFNTEHPQPRYTQGAFVFAFQTLFESYTNRKLNLIEYGKPHRPQYEKVEQMLYRQIYSNADSNNGSIDHIADMENVKFVGIGDNPVSDIRGANNAGKGWSSVLLKSGIYQEGHVLVETDMPDMICEDVLHAFKELKVID